MVGFWLVMNIQSTQYWDKKLSKSIFMKIFIYGLRTDTDPKPRLTEI